MIINYFGEGCFRLQSGNLSLLVNPANNRLKADVVLHTLNLTDAAPNPEDIAYAGEYEVKGIEIQGWQLDGESNNKFIKTVFAVDWENMRFVILGNISKSLPADIQDELGEPDVLFVPTGDAHFISAADAAKLVKQLEPKIVIPVYYKKNADEFGKAMGVKPEIEEKLVFRKKDLSEGKRRVVVVEAK